MSVQDLTTEELRQSLKDFEALARQSTDPAILAAANQSLEAVRRELEERCQKNG